MNPTATPLAVRVRWLVPVDGPPCADALLTLAGGRIVSTSENLSGRPPLDLGHVALLPALVNPHVHLEFSGLTTPLAAVERGFPHWIREVVRWRREWREQCADDATAADRRRQDVALGMAECRRTGTGLIGEIATPGWPRELFEPAVDDLAAAVTVEAAIDESQGPEATVFLELLGLAPQRQSELLAAAAEHVRPDEISTGTSRWRAGVSPHAPYTAGVDLVREVCRRSEVEGWPVAMHLAESPEELELLQSHSGPFHDLLVEWNVWNPSAVPRGIRPTDYLELLAGARRALVIHGNYLGSRDWSLLSAHRRRMTVVYCPRTHAYFGHAAYPLEEMLAAGVSVAVGTDSRASNPDLDLLGELRFVRRRFPRLAPRTILQLGTLRGAEALGRDADFGSITIGKLARFALVPLGDEEPTDIEEFLLDDSTGARAWP